MISQKDLIGDGLVLISLKLWFIDNSWAAIVVPSYLHYIINQKGFWNRQQYVLLHMLFNGR
jgi:hypothetical protein